MKKVSLLPSEVAATLSPSMQREMSEIVYGRRKSRRPPAHRGQYRSTNPKLRHESTKLHYILSGGEESVYQFAGKDNEDHFASAGGMLLRDDADDGNAFDAVYNEKFVHKDTESHFKDFGMTLVDDSDRGNAFDRVYNTAHEHKDTEDHFQSLGGMVLGDDADGTAEAEVRAALRAESYRKAEAAARARLQNYQSMKRMGNEQLDSAPQPAEGRLQHVRCSRRLVPLHSRSPSPLASLAPLSHPLASPPSPPQVRARLQVPRLERRHRPPRAQPPQEGSRRDARREAADADPEAGAPQARPPAGRGLGRPQGAQIAQ